MKLFCCRLPNFFLLTSVRILQITFVLCIFFYSCKAQYTFHFNDSILVITQNDTLPMAWAGGLNCPQFSTIDLNRDGLKDLFVFDKDGNVVRTFINVGSPGITKYKYDPSYEKYFPPLMNWALLYDYNCDGLEDIFTSNGNSRIRVYRNDYTLQNGFVFTLVADPLLSNEFGSIVDITVGPANLPTFSDVDRDGGLDIINFNLSSSILNYHHNNSIDSTGNCDSLDYAFNTLCWGQCSTSSFTCWDLGMSCRANTHPQSDTNSTGNMRHGGGTLLSLDLDGDGDKEMLVGDQSNYVTALYNGGDSLTANITTQDCTFPSYDVPAYINSYPACFYIDVDNDGKRDLLVSPTGNFVSENYQSVWYYHNDSTDTSPLFHLRMNNLFQNQMIELGSGAHPVFFDYDHDGKMDLLIGNDGYFSATGNYRGKIALYKNTGTLNIPEFTLVTNDFANIDTLHFNSIQPTFGDLDGDGDPDMIIGESMGSLVYFPDTTTGGYPVSYGAPVFNYQGLLPGQYASPQLIDIDRDGKLDLVTGNSAGKLFYFRNTGTVNAPVFTQQSNFFGGVNVREVGFVTGYAQPFFYDSAGSYRLFVGCERGMLFYYDQIDGNLGGNFHLEDSLFNYTYMNGYEGSRISETAADITGDGKLDFVIGNLDGGVKFFASGAAPVGIEKLSDIPISVKLFPNPTRKSFHLSLKKNDFLNPEICIFDVAGRLVSSTYSSQAEIEFNVSDLSPGFYSVKISDINGRTAVKKLIINN